MLSGASFAARDVIGKLLILNVKLLKLPNNSVFSVYLANLIKKRLSKYRNKYILAMHFNHD
ncbi:hypothetical protein VEZ01S_26_00050 [Vibrio ezurae NBRC 102218]|uniref:Uncharacterized protein n=1 Tax=Vibrio ezurae NBRC 102218 TaxID=1219080 RepID=U3CPT1_9VIBR|nr:hypothetical protein VEZ01S_26_00050 [Vibrio ezurae NBRC 102218]